MGGAPKQTTKDRGDAAEDAALVHLRRHGLALVQRNFRPRAGVVAKSI